MSCICSAWKQRPGTCRGSPKTTSAVQKLQCRLSGAFRIPSSTQGNDRVHDTVLCTAQRRAFFKVLWNRSTRPLACGWYEVVAAMDMPSLPSAVRQASEVNWAPRSEVTVAGTPKPATQPSKKACSTVCCCGVGQRNCLLATWWFCQRLSVDAGTCDPGRTDPLSLRGHG